MITTTEKPALDLKFISDTVDANTERALHLCDRIGSITEHTRAILEQHQHASSESVSDIDSEIDYDRNMMHLQARLETVMYRLQDTASLLESLSAVSRPA